MSSKVEVAEQKIIRCSSIGHPCARQIWYESVAGIEKEFDPRVMRIFDVGHALESVVLKWLEQDGWTVKANPGSQEAEMEVTIPVAGGILSGHPDAVISKRGVSYLVDVKTMNGRAFQRWKKEGTITNKFQYYLQIHPYAYGLGLDKLAIAAMNKDNSEYEVELLDFHQEIMDRIIVKAETILSMDEPPAPGVLQFDMAGWLPESTPIPAWCCNYCAYSKQGICDVA